MTILTPHPLLDKLREKFDLLFEQGDTPFGRRDAETVTVFLLVESVVNRLESSFHRLPDLGNLVENRVPDGCEAGCEALFESL